jgi:hypothetical protein
MIYITSFIAFATHKLSQTELDSDRISKNYNYFWPLFLFLSLIFPNNKYMQNLL